MACKIRSPKSVAVCAVWLLLLLPLLKLAGQFLSHAMLELSPPPGTESEAAKNKMTELFGNKINQNPMFIFIDTTLPGHFVTTDPVQNFSIFANKTIFESSEYGKDIVSVLGYYLAPEDTLIALSFVFPPLAPNATFISINYVGSDGNGFLDFLEKEVVAVYPLPDEYRVRLTGTSALVKDASKGTSDDLEHMDSISIPLALCVLGLSLWSVTLIFLPILTMPAAVLVAFSVMFLVTKVMAVPSFVASIMMSITIALSIDYALFLLSRFMEESKQNADNDYCVRMALHRSGETILVSGATIAIAFLGMTFFPVETLRVLGLGSFVSVCATMISNLSIIPALLFLAGTFFRRACPCLEPWERNIKSMIRSCISDSDEERGLNQSIDVEKKMRDRQARSWWYRLAQFTQDSPWKIIILVVVCCSPFIAQLGSLQVEFNLFHMLPRNSVALTTFKDMTNIFGKGRTSPYILIVETDSTILSEPFFSAAHELIDLLGTTANHPQPATSFTGIVRLPPFGDLTWASAQACLLNQDKSNATANTYKIVFESSTDAAKKATYINIATTFDPLGGEAADWISDIRDLLDQFRSKDTHKGMRVYFGGGATTSYDSVHLVYSKLGIMIGVTFGVIIIVITLAFRSAILPVLLSFAMLLILGTTFGMGRLVFGTSMMHGIAALSDTNALVWIVPVMSFSIICGLTLDYGIFLLTRVVEYRKAGFTTRASVIKAIYKVGKVISAAGVIMFIAFSGLMFSQEMVLNQFGFMLCFSVLLDTIVIVPLLLPALLAVASNLPCVSYARRTQFLWYPSKLPPEEKNEDDVSEDVSLFAAAAAVNYGGLGVSLNSGHAVEYPPVPSHLGK
eukprot:TRINITY_DN4044_c0_g1_i1.p1 TRINITY_DN4044_c0_g1~~TRINITY_DN4044_c0_g1_i1.p1  ORF type:complete len:861 (+),score=132.30 TRINITY_DN4044_c0_g1_i1:30-2585(+)